MKKILAFICFLIAGIGFTNAAVRDENATNRQNNPQQTSNRNNSNLTSRTATTSRTVNDINSTSSRKATSQTNVIQRPASQKSSNSSRSATNSRQTTIPRTAVNTRNANSETSKPLQTSVNSRAATSSSLISETVTGAEYEQCKTAYFTCMDQFCQLKNDDYRRCSCSNRVFELEEIRNVLQDAGNQLTVFTENLDVVGMTAAQATAMKTASEGENALTSDTSASKALLQAIMNSIRGEDSSVSGKYSDLNSINLSFDTTNMFGVTDSGQLIATYNGQNLYSAVYPQCREAVKSDCSDAQLQRAVTAYLMAIEQDCNAVDSAIQKLQKEMKSSVRENSALLDLARVENRQKHNSDDIATCLNNVETAILSEEVCGSNYKKCLDNGEFIDVSTGAPIAGVEKFYELGNQLTFADGVDAADQKLSKISSNRNFVQNFEKKVKKFAEPALDKCTEQADIVWEEYLDKALLEIYYAQQSKVQEIKQGCFDFVSSCYVNTEASLTAAMKELTGSGAIILQPDKITLSNELCSDYINSCNMMFYDQSGDIVTDYINNLKNTDIVTACRAVVKQCFDKFGGKSYENFYYPYSGTFRTGDALSWFTLYEYENGVKKSETPVSECAKQLTSISSCNSEEILEEAFGGFDLIVNALKGQSDKESIYYLPNGEPDATEKKYKIYGTLNKNAINITVGENEVEVTEIEHHVPRSTGVATEIYNQIIDTLSTQCVNLQGRFIEYQFINTNLYKEDNLCLSKFSSSFEYGNNGSSPYPDLTKLYGIKDGENMCPRDYDLDVDTQSWGACLCWENGGRRSKGGMSPKCVPVIPVQEEDTNDANCTDENNTWDSTVGDLTTDKWCTQTITNENQVCPLNSEYDVATKKCKVSKEAATENKTQILENLPDGLKL